mmetsp:Transcript_89935/g.131641  ORF Transcript_89935/g.131641 Transcript_89935/m.131641 type:complete len:85 (+) Transcript_89935:134-388(+)
MIQDGCDNYSQEVYCRQMEVNKSCFHTLLVMCVICNRLVMAQIMLREMRENVHSQSMDAAALVAFCVQTNRTEMRQLLMDEGGV